MEHIQLDWKLVKSDELKILEKYTKLASSFIVIVDGKRIKNKTISLILILSKYNIHSI